MIKDKNNIWTNILFIKLVIEMRKTQVKINKLLYLGFLVLDLNAIQIQEFFFDYINPIQDRAQEQKAPPPAASFSPVTSTNVGISP